MKAEKDWAAERILRKDAVRLDLKASFALAAAEGGGERTSRGSSSSSSMALGVSGSRGWSMTQSSPLDVERLFCRLSAPLRLFAIPGVAGLLTELSDSVSVSSDGMDSVEIDRADDNGPKVVSLSKLPVSCSESSGGLRSTPQD